MFVIEYDGTFYQKADSIFEWGEFVSAEFVPEQEDAITTAQTIRRTLGIDGVFIRNVTVSLGEQVSVILPEEDPEWPEYQRLKEKFSEESSATA